MAPALTASAIRVDVLDGVPDPTVLECMRDTMYSLQIDAPLGAGSIDVRKRFTFRRLP